METSKQPASRARRFWAFAIDQTILSIAGVVIFFTVFATQTQQLNAAFTAFFADPVWSQAEQLSSEEFSKKLDELAASEKVVTSVRALAHPFAVAMGLSLLVSAMYYIISTSKWGATPGKRWLHMTVNTVNGGTPDWWQSSVRYFAFIGLGTFSSTVTILDLSVNKAFLPSNSAVDVLGILLAQLIWVLTIVNIVMICARTDRRGLHDRFAHTIVYDARKN